MKNLVNRGAIFSFFALVTALAACGQSGHVGLENKAEGAHESDLQKVNSAQPTAEIESLKQQIAGAIADLTTRTGHKNNEVKVNQARSVTWGSSALGCPKQGMSYTQALVPGVLVILEAGGGFYRYHGLTGSKLFFCPTDRAKEPALGPGGELM